jgi:NAD(P)H-hydrate epimerase
MKVVTVDEMRRIEEACAGRGLPPDVLMENAGRAVAEEVQAILDPLEDEHVLVMVGPGNNGGDGLVAARHLHDWGAAVSVCLLGSRPENDTNLNLVRERDIPCSAVDSDEGLGGFHEALSSATAVIDSLFGTGLGTGRSREMEGVFRAALEAVAEERKSRPWLHLFAMDLPSGLDADTGAVDPACLHVDDTITLGFPKMGLFNATGAERAGQITVVDIGIPEELAGAAEVEVITDDWAVSVLPRRPLLANKGTFGRLLVVAGSQRYVGAAYLACSGAMRVGTGLVTLATGSSLQPILAVKLTESKPGVLSAGAPEILRGEIDAYDTMLIGCGLGQSATAVELVRSTVLDSDWPAPLVLDADALNALAGVPDWWRRLGDAILTPHPGEMSRLMGASVGEVQADRIGTARRMAQEWHQNVVLKGAYTVVATPDGHCRVNPMANPGLASAGTGDVLAGAIAGLRAQGLPAGDAAACGVFLHGEAAEYVRDDLGDAGMTASDLLPELPRAIQRLKEGSSEDGF